MFYKYSSHMCWLRVFSTHESSQMTNAISVSFPGSVVQVLDKRSFSTSWLIKRGSGTGDESFEVRNLLTEWKSEVVLWDCMRV